MQGRDWNTANDASYTAQRPVLESWSDLDSDSESGEISSANSNVNVDPVQVPVGRKTVTIVTMGMTGTGKSSFIKLLTGNEDIKVGEGIDPETSDISTYRFSQGGTDVILVDTPGFDDNRPNMSDSNLLKKVTQFLVDRYQTKTVNGLIYFHRINDVRFGGTATRNLRMFARLCGPRAMSNVVILTTRWDEAQPRVAQKNEAQLKNSYFKDSIASGAKLLRHDNTAGSAQKVISTILAFPPIADIKIVTETLEGRPLVETEAGRELDSQLTQLMNQHTENLNALREEFRQARLARDKEHQEEIKRLREELQSKLDKADKDRAELAIAEVSYAAQGAEIGRHLPFVPSFIGATIGGAIGGLADQRFKSKQRRR